MIISLTIMKCESSVTQVTMKIKIFLETTIQKLSNILYKQIQKFKLKVNLVSKNLICLQIQNQNIYSKMIMKTTNRHPFKITDCLKLICSQMHNKMTNFWIKRAFQMNQNKFLFKIMIDIKIQPTQQIYLIKSRLAT